MTLLAGEYVCGDVHTNGIEKFWSLLKRSIKGTQIHVHGAHLQRYVVERTFAYNERSADDLGRVMVAMTGTSGRRLTWNALTGEDQGPRGTRRWTPSLDALEFL
ncbi:MAG TPA: transposase [Acidimicrobiales bacterium]|jgi:hypothetical protein|nr:transposase [Acidimicrobiales bacterium]